jgi:hypothetical protein
MIFGILITHFCSDEHVNDEWFATKIPYLPIEFLAFLVQTGCVGSGRRPNVRASGGWATRTNRWQVELNAGIFFSTVLFSGSVASEVNF